MLLGSTNPTNGDSKVSQTFTAPAGSTTVSFYYLVHCPDDVTYDWATATLKDNTTGTTVTVLGRTCNLNTSYTKVSHAITAWDSYTLTLVNQWQGSPVTTGGWAENPHLSADGQRVVFTSQIDLVEGDYNRQSDAYLFRFDGGRIPEAGKPRRFAAFRKWDLVRLRCA